MLKIDKRIACLMVVLLVITLVGCGTAPVEEPAAPEDPDAEPVAAEPGADGEILIAYSQAELVNAWRVTNQTDMENQAANAGVRLISADANQDPSKQLSDVESMLAQQPDALILSPLESAALVPVVDMANRAGVPLIVIDRTIDSEPGVGMYMAEITQSHVEAGRLLAERTVEILIEKYGEPKGNVVHVQGMAGASPVIDANQGWAEVMADYPDIVEIAVADAGFTKEGGLNIMEDFLQRFPAGQIDVVRSDYSDMTMGAIQAIKAAGRTELLGYVVGQGGHYLAIEAVLNGEIAREVQTPPYFGELAIRNALDILEGKTVEAKQNIDIKAFDSNDLDYVQSYFDEIRSQNLEF
jgi:ABC-type sugar transport system substrate-binding protein